MKIAAQWAVVAVVSVLLFPAAALADTCHVGPPLEALGLGLHLSASLESAAYDNSRGAGTYLGAALAVAYRREWLRARVELPAYRLRRNSETFYGPGDLLIGTEVALVRDDKDTFAAGASLAVTVPTGDEAEDLGMGHFMLMPGVWGELTIDRAFVQMQLMYGKSLGSHDEQPADEHAGHHGHVQHTSRPGADRQPDEHVGNRRAPRRRLSARAARSACEPESMALSPSQTNRAKRAGLPCSAWTCFRTRST